MRKTIYLSITMLVVMLIFIGCKAKTLPTSVGGQWDLETINSMDGEILIKGEKENMLAKFSEDGTFQIEIQEENLQGDYSRNKELSTTKAIAINMNIDDGTEIIATYGIRSYQDGREVDSLIFTVDDKIYSFIRPISN